jgi:hypothetical protein
LYTPTPTRSHTTHTHHYTHTQAREREGEGARAAAAAAAAAAALARVVEGARVAAAVALHRILLLLIPLLQEGGRGSGPEERTALLLRCFPPQDQHAALRVVLLSCVMQE